tara:strand:- start:39 stop:266 length:228 start_codon:yes stop_codon:yes gene_type:complete
MLPKDKKYTNEHPKNKKSNIKVASSSSAQKRKIKLQEIFEGEVLTWEAAHDRDMPSSMQDSLYKQLRIEILGRSD